MTWRLWKKRDLKGSNIKFYLGKELSFKKRRIVEKDIFGVRKERKGPREIHIRHRQA